MSKDTVARASTTVSAPVPDVWRALITPETIEKYMFGARVASDWKEGSPISWKGEWKGKPYEDKGVILKLEPQRLLRYSHYSPLSGQPDVPDSYHTVSVALRAAPGGTLVELEQDNNATEETRAHSEKNWQAMLAGLKQAVEEKR